MKKLLRERQNEGGFTLIELLIVIIVLGILAGLVVFGVSTFRADAQAKACLGNAKNVEVASAAYLAATGGAAANIAALVPAYIASEPPELSTMSPLPDDKFSFADGVITRGANCN